MVFDAAMRCPQCGRIKARDAEVCWWCDPSVPESEKFRARVRGGRSSRKVHPLALDDLPESIDSPLDLKAYYMSIIRGTIDNTLTPSQCKALVSAGSALRDALELEMYQTMLARVNVLEDYLSEDIGADTSWELIEEPGLTDSTEKFDE